MMVMMKSGTVSNIPLIHLVCCKPKKWINNRHRGQVVELSQVSEIHSVDSSLLKRQKTHKKQVQKT